MARLVQTMDASPIAVECLNNSFFTSSSNARRTNESAMIRKTPMNHAFFFFEISFDNEGAQKSEEP